ncbi:uncharacterized protein PGTG_04371 [Puccinia graminis f. sp. tritici CRL 75-36-700-3]|uniref:Uncharacterized protein n=1 Tax=Puccinia graminis f. sp. tritici (strain CRL 75-36-700-3 / race SCCL) TaxID=418459 RepID=E3K246_PUCGT|nr:uncharacterized protein PGTG_04371 [Puccinia graminis f. sp. tritici CRL 75-36-700-3]EFP78415.1 hypothetical protein PGTG_04371 [Puccinia graminis f. sp. tritici CRL 75-36-700-3]
MKSIIKRIKRRASPTTASALLVPPVTTQTQHLPKHIRASSHEQSVRTRETFVTPSNNSSSQLSPDLAVPNNSRIGQSTSQDYKSPESATQVNPSHHIPENMESFISITDSSASGERSYTTRVSANSEERLSSHLPQGEEAQLESAKNDGLRSPSVNAPSIRTFGDHAHRQTQSNFVHVVPDDSERDSTTTYYEEKHTLKPVTRETIHKHVVEEVQKVKLHERHLTYVQHHVQPIINPSHEIEFQDYRIELPDQPGPQIDRINVEKKLKLDTIIDDLIRNNKKRYERDGHQKVTNSQSIELPDVEHQAMVVHNYHIIQPVILNPERVPEETVHLKLNKQTVVSSATEAKSTTLEDTYPQSPWHNP